MNRNSITLAAIAILSMAMITLSSCNETPQSNNKSDVDSTAVADDNIDVEVQKTYLTQDLATFDLYGQVSSVRYDQGEHTYPVVITFDKQGNLTSIIKEGVNGDAEEGNVSRNDENGRIEELWWVSDDPWITIFKYDGDGIVPPSQTMDTNQMGNYTLETYQRDADGNLVEVDFEEAVHGSIVEGEPKHVTTLSDFDTSGNWQTCTTKTGDYTFVTKRSISY